MTKEISPTEIQVATMEILTGFNEQEFVNHFNELFTTWWPTVGNKPNLYKAMDRHEVPGYQALVIFCAKVVAEATFHGQHHQRMLFIDEQLKCALRGLTSLPEQVCSIFWNDLLMTTLDVLSHTATEKQTGTNLQTEKED